MAGAAAKRVCGYFAVSCKLYDAARTEMQEMRDRCGIDQRFNLPVKAIKLVRLLLKETLIGLGRLVMGRHADSV